MTMYFEAFPETFIGRKLLRLCAFHLCLQMCVNMADPTPLTGVSGGYVDKKMVCFIF